MTNIHMPESPDGALVLRSYGGRPDSVLIRDDEAAKGWEPQEGERWFVVGEQDISDPLCWDVVTQAAEREGATLALLAPVEPERCRDCRTVVEPCGQHSFGQALRGLTR